MSRLDKLKDLQYTLLEDDDETSISDYLDGREIDADVKELIILLHDAYRTKQKTIKRHILLLITALINEIFLEDENDNNKGKKMDNLEPNNVNLSDLQDDHGAPYKHRRGIAGYIFSEPKSKMDLIFKIFVSTVSVVLLLCIILFILNLIDPDLAKKSIQGVCDLIVTLSNSLKGIDKTLPNA